MPSPRPTGGRTRGAAQPDTSGLSGAISGTVSRSLVITPVEGIGEVGAGDDVAALITEALHAGGIDLLDGDVLVVSSKILSKAQGLVTDAAGRDEVVLAESRRVVAERRTPAGLTRIVESLAGPVMAAAGVDASNTGAENRLLLLPHDPDGAAERLRVGLQAAWTAAVVPGQGDGPASASVVRATPLIGVVVSDTAGRPWRAGQVDFALGAAGVRVVDDLRGGVDADGRELSVTSRALADEIASAADLVKGKARRVPVAHVRGLAAWVGSPGDPAVGATGGAAGDAAGPPRHAPGARQLVRTGPQDWFGLGQAEAVRAALGVPPGGDAARRAGIASVSGEPLPERFERALRVALQEAPSVPAVRLQNDGRRVSLSDPDAFALGVVTARLVVALRGEGVGVTAEREAQGVTLTLE